MNDENHREVLRKMLRDAEHFQRTTMSNEQWHLEGEAKIAALTRALEWAALLDSDQYAPGPRPEPTTAELRAEAERLAREVWGPKAVVMGGAACTGGTYHYDADAPDGEPGGVGLTDMPDEHTALRALVAALRELRRGDG